MAFLINLCQTLGVFTLGYIFFHLLKLIHQLIRPSKNPNDYGKWSIVTGATDGIGKAIAMELAKKGQNVILIGRNIEKLNAVKNEIKAKYSQQEIEPLQIDLAQFDASSEKRFCDVIANKDIGTLVNSAGVSYEYPQYIHEVDEKCVQDIMMVNSTAPTLLMYRVIKDKFLKKTQPKKGIIVNISSAGSLTPYGLLTVYGATKTYINKISQDLALEYQGRGIEVQSQLPYFVVSKMSKVKHSSFTIPTAENFAKASVSQFGYSDVIFPYPIHAIMFFFVINFAPNFFLEKYVGDLHYTFRRKAMSKYGKKTD